MSRCKYKFSDIGPNKELQCIHTEYEDSGFCILHTPFPEKDKNPQKYDLLISVKKDFVEQLIANELYNFEGAILFSFFKKQTTFTKDLCFIDAVIEGNIELRDSNMQGNLNFNGIKIKGDADFNNSEIYGDAQFNRANFLRDVNFDHSKIHKHLSFTDAYIGSNLSFDHATIEGSSSFRKVKISGEVSFEETIFGKKSNAKEECCRLAKQYYIKIGDRDKEDIYYFMEMVAKRKQKKPWRKYPELIIQHIFSYGTRWAKAAAAWLIIVIFFGLTYYFIDGINYGTNEINSNQKISQEIKSVWNFSLTDLYNILICQYFSIVTATTLGYGDIKPLTSLAKLIAGIEAIFGTFMWAAFIAVFARKFMR
jgi:hypothetical protein